MNRLAGVLAMHTCQPMKEKCKELEVNHLQVKSARVQNKRSCQPNSTLRPSPPLSLSLMAGRALYVVDLNRGGYCWIRLSFISFPACSRNNTRRSSCQPDNTLRPSTPLPFSFDGRLERHRPRQFWMDYLSSIWMRVDVVCCICLLSLLLIAG